MDQLNSSREKLIKLARQLYQNAVSMNYGFVLWKFPGRRKPELFIGKVSRKMLSELTFPCFVAAPFQKNTNLVYVLEPVFYTHGKEWFILSSNETNENTVANKFFKVPSSNENGTDSVLDTYFTGIVEKAVANIKDNKLVKVVLSRQKQIILPERFDPVELFFRLTYSYKGAFVSFLSSKETGNWITASPELLFHSDGNRFKTVALAGTQINPSNIGNFSIKDKKECRVVAQHIRQFCEKKQISFKEDRLRVRGAGNLCHLEKRFYIEKNTLQNHEVLKYLHPTPAICGTPVSTAYDFIIQNEEHPRGLYSGFIGPAYNNNHWQFYVNLRCMKFYNEQATLFAGAGIMEDSDPLLEMKETENKMNTLMNIITKKQK